MRPQVAPHRVFRIGALSLRVQPAAVNDADASMTAMPAVLDEPPTLASASAAVMPCRSRRSRTTYLPVFSFLISRRSTPAATKSLSDMSACSVRCGEGRGGLIGATAADAPARVGFKPDDVPHLPSECVSVGGCVGLVVLGKFGAAFCHGRIGSSASGSSRSAIGGRAGTSPCKSPYIPETLKVTASI